MIQNLESQANTFVKLTNACARNHNESYTTAYHIIESALLPHVTEHRHADDRVNERDQGKQRSNVKERRQTNDEGKEQLSYSLGGFDQPQNSAYPEDPDDAQQSRRDREVDHDVLHEDAEDRGEDQDEVEEIPGHGEVVVAQADYLDDRLEAEDRREEGVRDLEEEEYRVRLVVVLDAHRQHVKEYQHEDCYLEPDRAKVLYHSSLVKAN